MDSKITKIDHQFQELYTDIEAINNKLDGTNNKETKPKKPKKKKCNFCNKKLGLVSFNCESCEQYFCTSCRYPEIHKCPNIDDKKFKEIAILKPQLPKIDFNKVDNKL